MFQCEESMLHEEVVESLCTTVGARLDRYFSDTQTSIFWFMKAFMVPGHCCNNKLT